MAASAQPPWAVDAFTEALRDDRNPLWSFATISDTHCYRGGCWPLTQQMGWLAANRDTLNLQFVLHAGDVTHHGLPTEWAHVRQAFGLLDEASLPYVVVNGNHDYALEPDHHDALRRLRDRGRHSLLSEFFPATELCTPGRQLHRYVAEVSGSQSVRHVAPPDSSRGTTRAESRLRVESVDNTASVFSTPDGQCVVYGFEVAPRESLVDAFGEFNKQHEDKFGIVLTHSYLKTAESLWSVPRDRPELRPGLPAYIPAGLALNKQTMQYLLDGQGLWDKFIEPNDNIALVRCGHRFPAYHVRERHQHSTVFEVMTDHQSETVRDSLHVTFVSGHRGKVWEAVYAPSWGTLPIASHGAASALVYTHTLAPSQRRLLATGASEDAGWGRRRRAVGQ